MTARNKSRLFLVGVAHESIARWLRIEAKKGFQDGREPWSSEYVGRCNCGVNLPQRDYSVSLTLTRDSEPTCAIGWHFSICCVTSRGYRGYSPAEGEHWINLIFGKYADRVIARSLAERGPEGKRKDVRHFMIYCDWNNRNDPVVALDGLV